MATGSPYSDIPYMDAYLRDILRPRVERALQHVSNSLNESVWHHVVRLLAAEQPAGNEESPAVIRDLIESGLGLRLAVRLDAAFTAAPGPPAPAAPASPTPEVTVRSGAMPLVSAILADPRRPGKR